jgi:hypothetical protein
MAGSPAGRGRGWGPLQHSLVWRGRRRWWICRGNLLAMVAPASTVAVMAVATWANDNMKQCNHQVCTEDEVK